MTNRNNIYSCLILVIGLGLTCVNSQPAQTNSTTSRSLVKVYSSYSASFYSAVQLQSLMQKSDHANDMQYDRSLALFRAVLDSKYRTKRYTDLRIQYDRLVGQQVSEQTQIIRVQNELNYWVDNRIYENRRYRHFNNPYNYYETQKQYYYTLINLYQSQINGLRIQTQNISNQILAEQLMMYNKALGDEKYLKKVLEIYALAGIKKAQQENLIHAQMKAREAEQKTREEWQAWVTFEYLSKYSTLKEKYEQKEISFDQFDKEKTYLEKERTEKLKLSASEGKQAYKETLKRLTSSKNPD